jgi:type I restriction-modification system DNA methylase subunit
MNLAIRGIEANLGRQHGDSFHNDLHKDLKADFILANPPFNTSDWGGERLRDDVRWKYGVPPVRNANYAWIQHMIHHLSPTGIAGFVLANGSMSSNQSGEGEIRRKIIEADLVDCMIALPSQLFYGAQIPACLWFLTRDKRNRKFRDRRRQTLFIDARRTGHLVDRVHRELSDEEIARITGTYHAWRGEAGAGEYKDVAGFCKSATTEGIAAHGYVLTPGRYVGAEETEDDLPAPRPGCFFVYAIRCNDDSIYIGHTDDLARRWTEHKNGQGADWTKKNKPVRIVHYEEYGSKEEAVAREKELKTTNGRRWIKEEIAAGRARQAGGEPFEEKMARLTATLDEQFQESAKLEAAITRNLKELGYGQ